MFGEAYLKGGRASRAYVLGAWAEVTIQCGPGGMRNSAWTSRSDSDVNVSNATNIKRVVTKEISQAKYVKRYERNVIAIRERYKSDMNEYKIDIEAI